MIQLLAHRLALHLRCSDGHPSLPDPAALFSLPTARARVSLLVGGAGCFPVGFGNGS